MIVGNPGGDGKKNLPLISVAPGAGRYDGMDTNELQRRHDDEVNEAKRERTAGLLRKLLAARRDPGETLRAIAADTQAAKMALGALRLGLDVLGPAQP